jgi:hypothetical protein
MKEGAQALVPFVRTNLAIDNPANSMGFGWLFAYLVMSGSPVAASALVFLEAEAIDRFPADHYPHRPAGFSRALANDLVL